MKKISVVRTCSDDKITPFPLPSSHLISLSLDDRGLLAKSSNLADNLFVLASSTGAKTRVRKRTLFALWVLARRPLAIALSEKGNCGYPWQERVKAMISVASRVEAIERAAVRLVRLYRPSFEVKQNMMQQCIE